MNILLLIIAFNLLPTDYEQGLLFMEDVSGWTPSIEDARHLDYMGIKYKKDEITPKSEIKVEQVIANK